MFPAFSSHKFNSITHKKVHKIIDMDFYTHDSIRLSDNNKRKLKKGDKEAFKLINIEKKI